MAINGVTSDLFERDYEWEGLNEWQLFPELVLEGGALQQDLQEETKTVVKQEPEVLIEQAVQPEAKPKHKSLNKDKDSTEDQIEKLEAEIAELVKSLESIPSTNDPSEKRKKANAISANISRRHKKLMLLEKDQLIERLQEQNAALLRENYELKAALNSTQYYEQPTAEFSITIPETTMFIKYKSPASSPNKPKVVYERAEASTSAKKVL